MSEYPGPVFRAEADRRSGGRRCDRAADRGRRGSRAQPHQRAGFLQAHRARRRAGDLGLPACLAARPVRSHLERAVSRLRRRARCPRHAEIAAPATTIIAACAPAATRPRSTSRSKSPSPSARKVRRIAAHDPNTLPLWEYFKQVFWSSGIDLNEESFASLTDEVTLDALELPAGEKAVLSLQLPPQFIIVFEPVTHSAHFIDVQGEPTKERQQLSLIYNKAHPPTGTIDDASGPAAAVARQPGRRAGAADGLHRGRCAASSARQAQAVPHRQADAVQPDLPRRLQGRQSQHRSAAQDHLADLPVHRPQGLDRALRAGRRSRRVRSGARAFPRAARDHRRRRRARW